MAFINNNDIWWEGIINNGITICVPIEQITNTSDIDIAGFELQVVIPTGLAYSATSTFQKGVYNITTNVWEVGTLLAGETLTAIMCFDITDETLLDYKVSFVPSSTTACDLSNASYCVTITGLSCSDALTCLTAVQDEFAPLDMDTSVTLTENPSLGHGVSVYRNGLRSNSTEYSLVLQVLTFNTAFGPSGGGLYSETVLVDYFKE